MPTRIAFLNTHPIQYFAPLYAHMNRAEDIEISALYLTDMSLRGAVDAKFGQSLTWDIDLLDGYTPIFAGDAARTRTFNGFTSIIAPELWGILRRERFDALVLHGHGFAAHHLALLAARSVGSRVFYRADTHLGKTRSPLRRKIRPWVLGSWFRLLDGCLSVGQPNAAFYRAMGVPEHRIFHMPYAVDNARFAKGAALPDDERRALRAKWGVTDDRPVLAFAGKFTEQKRASDLIAACAILSERGQAFHLLMAGAGPLQETLEAQARALLPPGTFNFPGFINQSALPALYGASDVFTLPSSNEAWGLAVNEAMACGLPLVICRDVGCAGDLLREGENGHGHEAGDIPGIADALEQVISAPERRAAMAARSREIVSAWDYDACTEAMRSAIAAVR